MLLIDLKQRSAWLTTPLLTAFLAAAVAQTPPPHIAIVDLLRTLIYKVVHNQADKQLVA